MDSTKLEVANSNPIFGESLLNDVALAAPCGVTVAAKRFSEEQSDGPAEKMLSHGTVSDEDPHHDPNSPGHSNEASKLDPEVIQAVFSTEHNGVMIGTHFCPFEAGYRHSYEERAKIDLLARLHVNEDDVIKSERPGSDSEYRKKEHDLEKERDHLKKEHDELKTKSEVFDKTLMLRQAYSDFEKTEEFEAMNDELKKEALKLLKRVPGKNKNFKIIVDKTLYTKILKTMFVQKVNLALKESFRNITWRNHYLFPKFRNHDPDYKWWEQNYIPKILEKRLEILREAAKKWNSKQDIFMVIELVTDMNSTLHPQTNGIEMFSLATEICSLRSGGDNKI